MYKIRILKSPLSLLLILSALSLLSPAWGDDFSDPYIALGITRPDHVLPAHNFSLSTLDGKQASIANDTVKQWRSQAIDMCFYWVKD